MKSRYLIADHQTLYVAFLCCHYLHDAVLSVACSLHWSASECGTMLFLRNKFTLLFVAKPLQVAWRVTMALLIFKYFFLCKYPRMRA
jgi:hypothetical protein